MTIKKILFPILIYLFSTQAFSQNESFPAISLSTCKVDKFLSENPNYDGRGTIIIIIDTGLDFNVPGLQKTSTGETKIIDVQDFTGQGDVLVHETELKGIEFQGIEQLKLKPIDGKYFKGYFEEKIFQNSNSGLKDINGNGKNDDRFGLIAFKTNDGVETFDVVFIDTNLDSNLIDEKPIRNYKEKFDVLEFPMKDKSEKTPISFGINIFLQDRRVSFFFDDGGHGTHVAGIAAGFRINEQDGYNGVAPGARLIGLKIGNNNLAGGSSVTQSMFKAYEYANKISKEKKVPVIVNMSFGIGSEIEGYSELEAYLDKLLTDNPYLVVCVSNGNDGPGISTAGLPASSRKVFSSGALLTQDTGSDVFNAPLTRTVINYFSSRGGEVNKPDVVTPGAMASTIPKWGRWDIGWGTSMASPYSTGIMSLLLSAFKQIDPDLNIKFDLLKKAIRYSATKMDGYNQLDQGAGIPDVPSAFNLLKKYVDNNENEKIVDYKITSQSPNINGKTFPNSYWRSTYFPTEKEKQSFYINRVNPIKGQNFYRRYILESDVEWMKTVQRKIYIRDEQSAVVDVINDSQKLKAPGLYVGKITAYRDDKYRFPEFEFLNVIVVPYELNSANNYEQSFENEFLETGMHKRYFLLTPPSAKNMVIRLSADTKEFAQVLARVFDPAGRKISQSKILKTTTGENEVILDLEIKEAGIYEVVVHSDYQSTRSSKYNVKFSFTGYEANQEPLSLTKEQNKFEVTKLYNSVFRGNAKATLSGYQRQFTAKLDSLSAFNYKFYLKKTESRADFNLSLSREDFNKFTDIALMIYDKDGNAVSKGGFTYKDESISVFNSGESDSTEFTLQVIGGFTHQPTDVRFIIEEKIYVSEPKEFKLKLGGNENLILYPYIKNYFELKIPKLDWSIKDNYNLFGKIDFESSITKLIEYSLPFYITN